MENNWISNSTSDQDCLSSSSSVALQNSIEMRSKCIDRSIFSFPAWHLQRLASTNCLPWSPWLHSRELLHHLRIGETQSLLQRWEESKRLSSFLNVVFWWTLNCWMWTIKDRKFLLYFASLKKISKNYPFWSISYQIGQKINLIHFVVQSKFQMLVNILQG